MSPLAPGLKTSYNKMKHGWTAGHNLRLDFRLGLGDSDRPRKNALGLVADGSGVAGIVGPGARQWLQHRSNRTCLAPSTNRRLWADTVEKVRGMASTRNN
jgi:hypothetical protein